MVRNPIALLALYLCSALLSTPSICSGCYKFEGFTCFCFDGASVLCPESKPYTLPTSLFECAEYCGAILFTDECTLEPCTPPNAGPTALPSISGTVASGQTLTGSYTYSDSDTPSDPEDTSASGTKFQWYAGTDADCTGKAAITGATSKTYTIQTSEVENISVSV